ncbi:MAG TPA: hypothetical protein VF613_04395, partial [Longimicrobium sp.]
LRLLCHREMGLQPRYHDRRYHREPHHPLSPLDVEVELTAEPHPSPWRAMEYFIAGLLQCSVSHGLQEFQPLVRHDSQLIGPAYQVLHRLGCGGV